MLGAESGPARGDRAVDPRHVGGHDVGVALDDDDPVPLGDRLLRQVEAVQQLALLVDRGLGRVEVLRRVLVVVQAPGPEAHGGPRDVADRPHEAPAEAVVDAARPLGGQPRGLDLLVRVAPRAQVPDQGVPAAGGVAHAEVGAHRLGEPAPGQELAALRGLGGGELGLVELLRDPVGVDEAPAPARLLGAHAGAPLLVVEGDPRLRGQRLDGLGEGQVVDLLDETDDVAALPAPEAVEHPHGGAHVEGGRPLVVEGAQALERADPGGLERDVVADDVLDPGSVAHCFDVVFAYEPGHGDDSTVRARRARAGPAGPPLTAGWRASRSGARATRRRTRR